MENNNIQDNSNKKKMIAIIVGIIVVALIAIVVVLLLNRESTTSTSGGSNTNSNSLNNTNTNTNVNSNTNSTSNSNGTKKDYVVDADYVNVQYKNQHEDTTIAIKGEQIKVPFINFDTPDATQVNQEIKTLYTEYEENIKSSMKCTDDNLCGSYSIGYKTYTWEDTISVVVEMISSGASMPVPDYLVYTFDIKTGKLLTLNDLLSKKGMTKEQLIEKTMTSVKQFAMSEDYKDSGILENVSEIESFIKKNMDLSQTKITEESGVAYFIDEKGNFNIVTTLYWDWESGTTLQVLSIQ